MDDVAGLKGHIGFSGLELAGRGLDFLCAPHDLDGFQRKIHFGGFAGGIQLHALDVRQLPGDAGRSIHKSHNRRLGQAGADLQPGFCHRDRRRRRDFARTNDRLAGDGTRGRHGFCSERNRAASGTTAPTRTERPHDDE